AACLQPLRELCGPRIDSADCDGYCRNRGRTTPRPGHRRERLTRLHVSLCPNESEPRASGPSLFVQPEPLASDLQTATHALLIASFSLIQITSSVPTGSRGILIAFQCNHRYRWCVCRRARRIRSVSRHSAIPN